MDYLDLRLVIREGSRGFEVFASTPDGRRATSVLGLPRELGGLRERLRAFERTVVKSGRSRGVGSLETAGAEASPTLDPVEFGVELFDSLFSGDVGTQYRILRSEADNSGRGVRIRLCCDVPEMAGIPWEFMRDPTGGDWLTQSRSTALIRDLMLPKPMKRLSIRGPLKILGLVSSPMDLPQLKVQQEREWLETATARLRGNQLASLDWVDPPTVGELRRRLGGGRAGGDWHVLHFIGHGDHEDGEGFIALEDGERRQSKLFADDLASLVEESVRLCVLNSCSGARSGGGDPLSSSAATLVRNGVPAVIAMQYEVNDDKAIGFAQTLYESLVEGLPVDRAVSEARIMMKIADRASLEWGTPVLYLHSDDGVLFQLDRSSARAPEEMPETLGVRFESIRGTLHDLDVPSRMSIELLGDAGRRALGLASEADIGAPRPFPVRWKPVDVRARATWLSLPRVDQLGAWAAIGVEGGETHLCREPGQRLWDAGVRDGMTFQLYVAEDWYKLSSSGVLQGHPAGSSGGRTAGVGSGGRGRGDVSGARGRGQGDASGGRGQGDASGGRGQGDASGGRGQGDASGGRGQGEEPSQQG